MKPGIKVSVYIISLNEEEHLARLLPQLADFKEVILVDSGSTDNTLKIAASFPNVSISKRVWSGFSEQKAYALSLCNEEWVLNLDADEELTQEYLNTLDSVINSDDYDALQTRRILLRWGKQPRCFIKDDVLIRLFRKKCGTYHPARVHEKIAIEGRIKISNTYFLHHENLSFSQRIQKSNHYSQLKAEDKFARGHRCSVLHLVLIFPLAFLQCYLGKGLFLDGGDGIATSMNHAFYNFMKYVKLRELWQQAQRTAKISVK